MLVARAGSPADGAQLFASLDIWSLFRMDYAGNVVMGLADSGAQTRLVAREGPASATEPRVPNLLTGPVALDTF